MEQPTGILPKGTRVRTHKVLNRSRMLCGPRTPDREGTIGNVVGGMGGDVYVVDHGGGQMAAYCWDEFEIVPNLLPKGTRIRTHKELNAGNVLYLGHKRDHECTIHGPMNDVNYEGYVVRHGDGTFAGYCRDEFELVSAPLTRGTRVRIHEKLKDRRLSGFRPAGVEGFVLDIGSIINGNSYLIQHGPDAEADTSEYLRDEFELVSSNPTVENLSAILAAFNAAPVFSEFRTALDELVAKNDPQRFAVNAASLAQLNVAAEPYAEQSAVGREAWTNAATMAAYLLLHAVHAAKSTP